MKTAQSRAVLTHGGALPEPANADPWVCPPEGDLFPSLPLDQPIPYTCRKQKPFPGCIEDTGSGLWRDPLLVGNNDDPRPGPVLQQNEKALGFSGGVFGFFFFFLACNSDGSSPELAEVLIYIY